MLLVRQPGYLYHSKTRGFPSPPRDGFGKILNLNELLIKLTDQQLISASRRPEDQLVGLVRQMERPVNFPSWLTPCQTTAWKRPYPNLLDSPCVTAVIASVPAISPCLSLGNDSRARRSKNRIISVPSFDWLRAVQGMIRIEIAFQVSFCGFTHRMNHSMERSPANKSKRFLQPTWVLSPFRTAWPYVPFATLQDIGNRRASDHEIRMQHQGLSCHLLQ